MRLDKITYQKLFVTGSFTNEKIGVEISIDPTDNSDEVFKQAKAMVERWHEENNPHLAMQLQQLPETQLTEDKADEVTIQCNEFMRKLAEIDNEEAAYKFMAEDPSFSRYFPAKIYLKEKFKKQ